MASSDHICSIFDSSFSCSGFYSLGLVFSRALVVAVHDYYPLACTSRSLVVRLTLLCFVLWQTGAGGAGGFLFSLAHSFCSHLHTVGCEFSRVLYVLTGLGTPSTAAPGAQSHPPLAHLAPTLLPQILRSTHVWLRPVSPSM